MSIPIKKIMLLTLVVEVIKVVKTYTVQDDDIINAGCPYNFFLTRCALDV